jgi:hypothetical protein
MSTGTPNASGQPLDIKKNDAKTGQKSDERPTDQKHEDLSQHALDTALSGMTLGSELPSPNQ